MTATATRKTELTLEHLTLFKDQCKKLGSKKKRKRWVEDLFAVVEQQPNPEFTFFYSVEVTLPNGDESSLTVGSDIPLTKKQVKLRLKTYEEKEEQIRYFRLLNLDEEVDWVDCKEMIKAIEQDKLSIGSIQLNDYYWTDNTNAQPVGLDSLPTCEQVA